jgi:phospholipid/cholesterol/gamma-HCH transport system substrate-binding protein
MENLFQNKEEKKEFIVGAIAFLLGVIGLVYTYVQNPEEDAKKISDDKYIVSARFNRTDGLFAGDEVRLAGIKVGIVSDLKIDESYGAIAKLLIKKEVDLPEDTGASIETDGLFGGKHVELEPGGAMYMIEKDNQGNIVYTQDAMVVEELLDKLINIGKKARGIDENLDKKTKNLEVF